jgi:Fur family zinc uptake transcriptional regulator
MSSREPLAFAEHDHEGCRADALGAARQICRERRLRLTPVRGRVLDLLWQAHRPLRAYDILEILGREGFGSQPPVVYRALDFLLEQGFAHKIERLNAFIACAHPGASHAPAFMICRLCQSVAEAQSTPTRGALGEAARAAGFQIEQTVVEAEGICPNCAQKADA